MGQPLGRARVVCLAVLVRNRRGNVAIMVALAAACLIGFAGLFVDAAYLYTLKTKLQSAADAAALAAVRELPDENAARSVAVLYAERNLPAEVHGSALTVDDVEVGTWDTEHRTFVPGGAIPNAIRLTVSRSQEKANEARTFFASLLGFAEVDVRTQAIARRADPVCLLALDSTGTAIDVQNGSIVADGCNIHVNSGSTSAITGQTQGTLAAAWICVVGSYASGPTYSPTPETGCPAMADPLAGLAEPSESSLLGLLSSCDYTGRSVSSGNATLNPGVYCDDSLLGSGTSLSLTTNGTVTLNPGIYVIKGGLMKIGGNTTVNGTGVMFYFVDSGSRLQIAGGAKLNLSALTDGTYAGVLIFGSRGLPSSTVHELVGGADIRYEGTIYFPTTVVRFVGNGSSATRAPYTMFIARRFQLAGNGSIYVAIFSDYEASDVPLPNAGARRSRLVQ